MKCSECESTKWEVVISNIRTEEDRELDMYQCVKCKRLVVVPYHIYDEDVEV